jgi:oligopeptide transport system ATP-binding protein
MSAPLLGIEHLEVSFDTAQGVRRAVDDLSFALEAGEALGIVGESGSGKSQTAFAIMGLLAASACARGSVRFEGRELLGLPEGEMNRLRGDRIALVFQDPMTALNPYLTIGAQMAEVLVVHRGASQSQALAESARMLDALRIPAASDRLRSYPHEFSGGMRQRVMIAMALLTRPRLLIADEPTTALDVTVQAQILRQLRELRREFGTALLLITHDLGVVAEACERVLVMYAGRCVETGPAADVLAQPAHPYTLGLLHARPRLHGPIEDLQPIPGGPPALSNRHGGCVFRPRCAFAMEICAREQPILSAQGADRSRACFAHTAQVRSREAQVGS